VGLVSRETTNDARLLREEIVNLDATALQGTPTTWRMLLEAGLEPAPSFKCFCGGEAMPGDLKEALLATGAKVWNLYGPTETTIWSTLKRLTSDCPPALGRPIANTQVYVLDGALQPLPVGVAGELYIGGVGLARGYLNQPALTAERFIPDPFKGEPGARLYKTGDLVRYLSNGDLDYQGRVDFQVKIRGFRIELAEIETALTRHPWVRQAVVAARQNPSGEKGLVAYVVREPESQDAAGNLQFNVAELREFLLRSLPAYMIPQTFEVLAALPETQNGKIDRNLLPAPKFLPLDERRPFVSPRTQTEQQLTNIWSDLLGIDKISVDDDFFELGGDSLQMQRMIARVMQTFEQTVPVRAVFLNPSVSHIASLIDRTKQITASEENRLNGLVSDLSDEEVDSLLKDLLVVTS
jgi:acyl carrier protein